MPPSPPTMLPWELQKNREWRALFQVRAFVALPENFVLHGATCSSQEVASEPDGRRQILVATIYVSEDIESAYFQAHDLAQELADRIAFLSLAAVEIGVASVTYPAVDVGATFEIAMPVPDANRSPVKITAEEIAQFDKPRSETVARAMRLFRTGASSSSSYHALAQLWAAAEVLGRECAEHAGSYVEYPCKTCGAVQKGPPRTLPYIAGFLEAVLDSKSAVSASEAADAARKTRGKVIHGGKLQDQVLRREVDNHLGHLQSGVAAAVSRATGITTSILRARHVGAAVMYAQVVAQREMAAKEAATVIADMHFGKWAVKARGGLPAIPKDCGREQEYQIAVLGLAFPMIVPNLFWPTVST